MYPRKDDPELNFLESALFGSSAAIESSEKRGQADLVESEVLPRNCNGCTRHQIEQMGIVYGENADDIFIYVTLPAGWKKVPTDHSMWSSLVDDKGRIRANIFYKAAFYDRSAHISLCRRYTYKVQPVGGYTSGPQTAEWYGIVVDSETIIKFETEHLEPEPPSKEREQWLAWLKKQDGLKTIAKAWLEQNFPDWENPLAYW